MKVEIKLSVTIRSSNDVDWVTIVISDDEIIEMAKNKAIDLGGGLYDVAECDEITSLSIED